MNPRHLIAELQAIVHAPPHKFTAGQRQQARDALVMIHMGLAR